MGGLLTRYKLNASDPLVAHLKEAKARDIDETMEYYIINYPNTYSLSFEDFDDLFSPILSDVTSYFDRLSQNSEQVDLFETLALIVLACQSTVQWKVEHLFQLFDFDNSGTIDMNELVMTIGAFTRALGKIGTGIVPNKATIYNVARQIFLEIDKDESKTLSLEEIQTWTENNEEFQEIMAILSSRQSYQLAKIKFDKKITVFDQIFQKIAEIIEGDKVAHKGILIEELRKVEEIQELEEAEVQLLIKMMSDENSELVTEDNYFEAIKDWVAYSVSDFLKTGKIDKGEIRVLMSFQKGKEVTLDKVEEVMRAVDTEKKGYITRREWLQYTSGGDIHHESRLLRGNLRHAFNDCDTDGSGSISSIEIENLMKEVLRSLILSKIDHNADIDDLINGITSDIIHMAEKPELSWLEFKKFFPIIEEKIDSTQKFIKEYL